MSEVKEEKLKCNMKGTIKKTNQWNQTKQKQTKQKEEKLKNKIENKNK